MLSAHIIQEALGEDQTLRVLLAEATQFSSPKRWLHPLFDLKSHLAAHPEVPWGDALLIDRVTGRAAAFMLADLGIRRVWSGVLSHRAVPVLEAHGIAYEAVGYVERIGCSTEESFLGITDLAEARAELERLRQRSTAKK